MRFSYSKWHDDLNSGKMQFDELLKLFNQLLLYTSGDVNEALQWLTYLDNENGFFSDEFNFDDFVQALKDKGILQDLPDGQTVLTPKGVRGIRQDSLDEIFSSLRKSPSGFHETHQTGDGVERLSETRPFKFGDAPSSIDFASTVKNAMKRSKSEDFDLVEGDFEVYETEHLTNCSTVLAIDISHSMILYGEDRITPAKKVAMGLIELIMSKYPKDTLDILSFGDDAEIINLEDITYLSAGPYHTNTKAALQLGRKLLHRRRNANKQIFMITDGKPSCIWMQGRLYKNPFGLDRRVVNQTLNEAAQCKKENITISTFMIARDPVLVNFVDDLTKVNKGRAFYAGLNHLGQYVFVDYMRNRRKNLS